MKRKCVFYCTCSIFLFNPDYFDQKTPLINEGATFLLHCHVLRIKLPLLMTQNIPKINTHFGLVFSPWIIFSSVFAEESDPGTVTEPRRLKDLKEHLI